MTEREVVIQHVKECMVTAFIKGDLIEAQNQEAFIRSLEGMTDQGYNEKVSEEIPGAIS